MSSYDTSSSERKWSTSSTGSLLSSPQTSRPSSISYPSQSSSPRVQLVPHTLSLGFEAILSPSERRALDNSLLDTLDLSSQDFDFEDIFTYGRPQQKLSRVVEVSSPTFKERDTSGFSFSHYSSTGTVGPRPKVTPTRTKSGISEMYLKNGKEAARKRF